MLKFTALDRNNKTGYFLGLSRNNIERLMTNQPIKINLADMGGPDAMIVIMFGENDRLLFQRTPEIRDDLARDPIQGSPARHGGSHQDQTREPS
jgi:hypothetical protein